EIAFRDIRRRDALPLPQIALTPARLHPELVARHRHPTGTGAAGTGGRGGGRGGHGPSIRRTAFAEGSSLPTFPPSSLFLPAASDILRPLLYGFLISRLPDGACRRGDVSFAGRDRADDRGALPSQRAAGADDDLSGGRDAA